MTYFKTKEKLVFKETFFISKLIFKIALKMKVSLLFRVVLVFVFSFGNCWTVFEDNQNEGLHRIPVHRTKRFRPNLKNVGNGTEFNSRKYDFNNRKHAPKPVDIKQYNFINQEYTGEISIGTPEQSFLV